ncbi:MAG: N-acetylmuramoyl-L-alanine amidase [Bacteroidales bacterium]|jgi:N-acetylmuramoyl-L-alanine amidase|nr:N-acetylmuramoyl-L-alanine amidase [Bacteroidales bacterium]
MEIKNNRLVDAPFVAANAYNKTAVMKPDAIIIHYTAGASGNATVKLFSAKTATTSAHFVVSEDGSITQMVDLNRKAYHAGTSSYNGRSSYNSFSIGIEISNPGYLQKIDGKYYTWWEAKKEKKTPVAASNVFVGKHRNAVTTMTYWYKYTDAQIKAVTELCKAICRAYEIKEILGHEEIAPGRKCDPGPAFPLDALRADVMATAAPNLSINDMFKKAIKDSAATSMVIGRVKVKLNFRQSPSTTAALKASPIPADSYIYIIGQDSTGEWYNILHEISGWIDKEYIEQDNTDSDYDGELTSDSAMLYNDQKKSRRLVSDLKAGTKFNILEQQENMFRIKAVVEGWACAKYISKV